MLWLWPLAFFALKQAEHRRAARPVSERSALGRRASSSEKHRGRRTRRLLVPFGPSRNVRETSLTSRQRWPARVAARDGPPHKGLGRAADESS
ncbi:Hypothetical protein I596_886 [Dokdonella koreensis DS-123]|uniref:Uncharacterized protein n=1 Tax=Dokdonella koreensis DS-123 TaxID=1300342 RepID=A0A160DRS2_9GAMM|nr:Hypothetical protein I596_886 [Dokdonella koreensis DS-123]